MHLTPQQKQITDMLADGAWHCPTVELYMKDDRKRISELKDKGFIFDESGKTCTDPTHRHRSPVKLRRLISWPSEAEERVRLWNKQFEKPKEIIKQVSLF